MAPELGSAINLLNPHHLFPKEMGRRGWPEECLRQAEEVAAAMLRISTHEDSTTLTLVLEGKCRGPWVEELERCWRSAVAIAPSKKVCVDLENVGFVDARSKDLLTRMCAEGVQFIATGPLMNAIVNDIMAGAAKQVRQRA